jgi:hypothetical protein
MNSRQRAEALLLRYTVLAAVAFGIIFMVGRFIMVVRENLRQPAHDWPSIMLLAVLIGGVSFYIVACCAAVGSIAGLALRALFARRLAGIIERSRHQMRTRSAGAR